MRKLILLIGLTISLFVFMNPVFAGRYYIPEISRWATPDPLADKYPNISSYVYCLNNPLINIDPDGKRPWRAHEKEIVINAMREAEKRYASNWGEGLRKGDQGGYAPIDWHSNLGVEIEGLQRYEDMSLKGQLSISLTIGNELVKSLIPGMNSDPYVNSLSGTDPTYGGSVNYLFVQSDSKDNNIFTIVDGDKGGKVVPIYYYAKTKNGKNPVLIQMNLTREQYEKWREDLQKMIDEARNKKDEEDKESKN